MKPLESEKKVAKAEKAPAEAPVAVPVVEEKIDFSKVEIEPEELVGKTLLAITNLPPRPMMGIESCGMLISAVHHEEGEEKLHLLMLDNHIPAGAKMY